MTNIFHMLISNRLHPYGTTNRHTFSTKAICYTFERWLCRKVPATGITPTFKFISTSNRTSARTHTPKCSKLSAATPGTGVIFGAANQYINVGPYASSYSHSSTAKPTVGGLVIADSYTAAQAP